MGPMKWSGGCREAWGQEEVPYCLKGGRCAAHLCADGRASGRRGGNAGGTRGDGKPGSQGRWEPTEREQRSSLLIVPTSQCDEKQGHRLRRHMYGHRWAGAPFRLWSSTPRGPASMVCASLLQSVLY